MAGLKRKEPPTASRVTKGNPKKVKTRAKTPHQSALPPPDLEAESDSDPIIESDTTEHSGDDDGVSWPSDDEEVIPPMAKSKSIARAGGGVKLPIEQSKQENGIRIEHEGANRKNNR